MNNELYHHGVKGMKWGVRNDLKGRYARRALRDKYGNLSGHYRRNEKNVNLPKNSEEAKKMGFERIPDKAAALHQNHTEDGVLNSKWMSKDGKREVIFSGKGENEHINNYASDKGSYNYADYRKHPLQHAIKDVVPYYLFGNDPNDKTTIGQRLIKTVTGSKSLQTSDMSKTSCDAGYAFVNRMKSN